MSAAAKSGQGDAPGLPEAPAEKASDLFARGTIDGMASSDVSAVVKDAETALVTLRARASRIRAVITDPALDAVTVAWAKQEVEALDLESSRMEEAAARLRKRADGLAADEADVPRWERYNAAKAARDAAEAALVAYPKLADQIAALLAAALAADDKVNLANFDLPRDAEKLKFSHCFARGFESLIGQVKLPRGTLQDQQHWPPPGQNAW